MSILKKAISLLLCIVLAGSIFASCGTTDPNTNETSAATTEVTQAHEASDATTEATQATTSATTNSTTQTDPPAQTTEPPQGHTHSPAAAVTENYKDSSCTQAGSYDEVVYCSSCKVELSRTSKTIDKKPHEYNQKVTTSTYLKADATCTESASYYFSCVCGDKGTATFTSGDAKGHSYASAWEKDSTHHWHKATCEHTNEISAKAEHVYGTDNVCDTCGYDKSIAVSGVTLNASSLNVKVGNTGTLVATVAPDNATNKKVTWTTSNPAIVTVDSNGHIAAVGVGTATITVTTENGSKTASCTVTVSPKICLHSTTRIARENEIDSTCKAEGSYNEVVYCADCGDKLSTTAKTIAKKTEHTAGSAVQENVVDSTCKVTGSYDEVVCCSVCNTELSRVKKTIDKKQTHTEGAAVKENYVAPTLSKEGSYDSVIYCTVCGKELSRTTITIPTGDEDDLPID